MELILPHLRHVLAGDNFTVKFRNLDAFESYCSIKFVYLEIGTQKIKGSIFLPDYGPAVSFGENEGKIIMFNPFANEKMQDFTLMSSDTDMIDAFLHLAMNSMNSLRQIALLVKDCDLEYESHMIFRDVDSVEEPTIVKFHGSSLVLYSNGAVLKEIEIFSNTILHFPPINKHPYFGIQNDEGKVMLFHVVTFDELYKWYTLINIIKLRKTSDEYTSVPELQIETISVTHSVTKTNAETQLVDLRIEKSKKNDFVADQKEKISNDLKALKLFENQKEIMLEPQIPYPKKNDTFVPLKPSFEKAELCFTGISIENVMQKRVNSPRINLGHFLLNRCLQEANAPFLGYDKECNDYYSSRLLGSTPQVAYILLLSATLNGFVGDSLLSYFQLSEKSTGDQICDAAIVINKFKFRVFDYFNQSPFTEYNYLPSSIARDQEITKKFSSIGKEVDLGQEKPQILPYLFPHDPIKDIAHNVHSLLYIHKISKCNDTHYQILSRKILGFFLHYAYNNQPFLMIQSISQVSKNSSWSFFRGSNELSISWDKFFLSSLKEGTLISNLLLIYSDPQTIISSYYPCSQVRKQESITELFRLVQLLVFVFESQNTKAKNDGEKAPEFISSAMNSLYSMFTNR